MNPTTESTTLVAERLQLCLSRFPVDPDPRTPIASLGLDSMDTVELLCAIHEEFGVRLTESDFHPGQTIGGLVQSIAVKTTN